MWQFVVAVVVLLRTGGISHSVDAALLLRPMAKPCVRAPHIFNQHDRTSTPPPHPRTPFHLRACMQLRDSVERSP
jgi:hypothetical protein